MILKDMALLYISNDDVHCRKLWQQLALEDVEQVCEIINVDQRQKFYIRRMMSLHHITHVPTMVYQGSLIQGAQAILAWFGNLYDMCDEMRQSSTTKVDTKAMSQAPKKDTSSSSALTYMGIGGNPHDILEDRLQDFNAASVSEPSKNEASLQDQQPLNPDNPFRHQEAAEDRKGNSEQDRERINYELQVRGYEGM